MLELEKSNETRLQAALKEQVEAERKRQEEANESSLQRAIRLDNERYEQEQKKRVQKMEMMRSMMSQISKPDRGKSGGMVKQFTIPQHATSNKPKKSKEPARVDINEITLTSSQVTPRPVR